MAISVVQSAKYDAGSIDTYVVTFGANVTAGNTIALFYGSGNGPFTNPISIVDTPGNSYQKVRGDTFNGDFGVIQDIGMYYAAGIAGGPCTITVTYGAAQGTGWAVAVEIAGVDPTMPFDASSGVGGSGTSVTSTLTTVASSTIVLEAIT